MSEIKKGQVYARSVGVLHFLVHEINADGFVISHAVSKGSTGSIFAEPVEELRQAINAGRTILTYDPDTVLVKTKKVRRAGRNIQL